MSNETALMLAGFTPAQLVEAAYTALVNEAVSERMDLTRPGILNMLEDRAFGMLFEAADKVRDRVLPAAQEVAF